MLAITSERVSLTEKLINSQSQDVRAAARNRELLVDLRQALHTLHATQRRAREEDQLAELRAELLEVQARRERARADFEADLRAKEEAARIKQELAAQKELERYGRVEREAVRAGVSAEVAAAVTAVEDGLADVVRRAAAQTRQAVAAQVRSQTSWLSAELPTLLRDQATRALRQIGMHAEGDAEPEGGERDGAAPSTPAHEQLAGRSSGSASGARDGARASSSGTRADPSVPPSPTKCAASTAVAVTTAAAPPASSNDAAAPAAGTGSTPSYEAAHAALMSVAISALQAAISLSTASQATASQASQATGADGSSPGAPPSMAPIPLFTGPMGLWPQAVGPPPPPHAAGGYPAGLWAAYPPAPSYAYPPPPPCASAYASGWCASAAYQPAHLAASSHHSQLAHSHLAASSHAAPTRAAPETVSAAAEAEPSTSSSGGASGGAHHGASSSGGAPSLGLPLQQPVGLPSSTAGPPANESPHASLSSADPYGILQPSPAASAGVSAGAVQPPSSRAAPCSAYQQRPSAAEQASSTSPRHARSRRHGSLLDDTIGPPSADGDVAGLSLDAASAVPSSAAAAPATPQPTNRPPSQGASLSRSSSGGTTCHGSTALAQAATAGPFAKQAAAGPFGGGRGGFFRKATTGPQGMMRKSSVNSPTSSSDAATATDPSKGHATATDPLKGHATATDPSKGQKAAVEREELAAATRNSIPAQAQGSRGGSVGAVLGVVPAPLTPAVAPTAAPASGDSHDAYSPPGAWEEDGEEDDMPVWTGPQGLRVSSRFVNPALQPALSRGPPAFAPTQSHGPPAFAPTQSHGPSTNLRSSREPMMPGGPLEPSGQAFVPLLAQQSLQPSSQSSRQQSSRPGGYGEALGGHRLGARDPFADLAPDDPLMLLQAAETSFDGADVLGTSDGDVLASYHSYHSDGDVLGDSGDVLPSPAADEGSRAGTATVCPPLAPQAFDSMHDSAVAAKLASPHRPHGAPAPSNTGSSHVATQAAGSLAAQLAQDGAARPARAVPGVPSMGPSSAASGAASSAGSSPRVIPQRSAAATGLKLDLKIASQVSTDVTVAEPPRAPAPSCENFFGLEGRAARAGIPTGPSNHPTSNHPTSGPTSIPTSIPRSGPPSKSPSNAPSRGEYTRVGELGSVFGRDLSSSYGGGASTSAHGGASTSAEYHARAKGSRQASAECDGGAAGSMFGDDLSESLGGGGPLTALADADFGRDLSESYGMGSVADSLADSCGGLSPGGGAQGVGGSHGGHLGGGLGGRGQAGLGGGSLDGSLGMGDDLSSYGGNEPPSSAVLGARPTLSRQQQQAAFQTNLSRSKCAPVSARQPAMKAPPPAAAGQGLSSPETSPLKLPAGAAVGGDGVTAEAPAPPELPPLLADRDKASLVSSGGDVHGDAHGDASRAPAPAPAAMRALDYSSSEDGSPTTGVPANPSQLARNFRAKADALGHSRAGPARMLGGGEAYGAPSASAHYGAPSASATPLSNAAIKPKGPKTRAATIASLAGDSDSECSLEEIGIGTPASKGAMGSGSDFDDF